MFEALKRHLPKYDSVHISDNNRRYPGKGAIDFSRIIAHLDRIGFIGPVTIEGNVVDTMSDELRDAAMYLASCGSGTTDERDGSAGGGSAHGGSDRVDGGAWAHKRS